MVVNIRFIWLMMMVIIWLMMVNKNLVGGAITILKNMSSSNDVKWEYDIPN